MREESRRSRRKQWLNKLISVARRGGDKRSRGLIASEIESRSKAIRDAEREAYRDPENSEVVVRAGYDYPIVDIHEGEVLHRGLRYIHPSLTV